MLTKFTVFTARPRIYWTSVYPYNIKYILLQNLILYTKIPACVWSECSACTYFYSGDELSTKLGQFVLHWPSQPSPAFGSPHSDAPTLSRSKQNTAHSGSLPPSTPRCTHYVFVAEERERVRLELHLSAPPPDPNLSATTFARYRDPFSSANQKPKVANGCERMLRVYASLDTFEVDDSSKRDIELCLSPLISPGILNSTRNILRVHYAFHTFT